MTKLVAIHQLHLAGAAKGTVEVIEPGQVFVAREDELTLTNGGIHAAAREYNAETDKALKVFARSDASAVAEAGGQVDLKTLKKAELIALAKAEGIEIDEAATNAVLIKTIEYARAAKEEAAI